MRISQGRSDDGDSRILPLINIVFLLLIFFLVTGALTAADPFRTTPPHSIAQTEARKDAIVILLGSSGQIAFDGRVMDEAGLKNAIGTYLASEGAGAEGQPPAVHLKADADVSGTRLVSMLNLLRDAGLERLNLLAVQKQE